MFSPATEFHIAWAAVVVGDADLFHRALVPVSASIAGTHRGHNVEARAGGQARARCNSVTVNAEEFWKFKDI